MRRTITGIALLLVALPLFADIVDDWRRDQAAIEALLQQKQYANARRAAIKLTNRMLDRLGGNADASKILAQTVALRAAAEDGLRNVDDTNWYRQVAKALDPQVALPTMTTPLPEPIIAFLFAPGTMQPPKVTRQRPPERPGMVSALGDAIVVVGVTIDVDGVVRQPHIVSSPAPSVSYAAFEAVKQWRFEPGRMDGKPVPVSFNLTVHFR